MHRPADEEIVASGIDLGPEMGAIRDANIWWDRQRIGKHVPGTVGHPDGGRHLVRQDLITHPFVEVEPLALRRVEGTRA